jgi:signal transduction histidine kinase
LSWMSSEAAQLRPQLDATIGGRAKRGEADLAAPQDLRGIALKISPQPWRFSAFRRTVERFMARNGLAASSVAVPLPATAAELASRTRRAAVRWPTLKLRLLIPAVVVCASPALAALYGPLMLVPVAVCGLVVASRVSAERRRRLTAAAAADERTRIARNLHDGLAQELAYIRMETMRMAAAAPGDRVESLVLAAERALEESRRAIATLSGESAESFDAELSQVAKELTGRAGAQLSLHVDPEVEVAEERRDALLRIIREAITNGVRHGRATEVALEVSGGSGLRVAVRDNGHGFVPGGPRRRGSFGLTTMTERAQALGGVLTVHSQPGEGTLVEVVLP